PPWVYKKNQERVADAAKKAGREYEIQTSYF
ncbi:unnamed protein product, partial [marine sediment metagenome]